MRSVSSVFEHPVANITEPAVVFNGVDQRQVLSQESFYSAPLSVEVINSHVYAFCNALDASESLDDLSELLIRITAIQNPQVKLAMKKEVGYVRRFFSDASWEEWLEDKTELGQVIYAFAHSIENPGIPPEKCTSTLTSVVVQKANIKAATLLQSMQNVSSEVTTAVAPSPSLWSRACSFFSSVDKKLTQLIPSFPGAMAATTKTNCVLNADGTCKSDGATVDPDTWKGWLSENTIGKLVALGEKFGTNTLWALQKTLSTLRGAALDQKEVETVTDKHAEYVASYKNEVARRDAAKETCNKKVWVGSCYDISHGGEPMLDSQRITGVDEDGKPLDKLRLTAYPGYLCWSVYQNIGKLWPDSYHDSGQLNCDPKTNEPTVTRPPKK